ncbi:hypothetical protein Syun_019218 [Stephania yunnanensis]|uniref:Uncharacterized protein n=1 Tax=Stephania yunnanensis TaxID=152371 RepID=A0AAP0NZ74_9MAGN
MVDSFISKPDVVEGTDDERVWSLPCWDLTETSKRDDGIDLLKDKQALRRLTETAEKAKMDLSSLTQTNIRLTLAMAGIVINLHLPIPIVLIVVENWTYLVHGWGESDPHRKQITILQWQLLTIPPRSLISLGYKKVPLVEDIILSNAGCLLTSHCSKEGLMGLRSCWIDRF